MPDGTLRYCNMTNGGPLFVYVKDGKIVRITPIDFDHDRPQPWTIEARGRELTPPRKTTLAPHGQTAKSIVYSPDRLLYPMKRVDFDPNGARNPQNRGKSGYVRICWDEALDLVAGEIKRSRATYGPGAMAVSHGSHHTWGNIGYYLSALLPLPQRGRLHRASTTTRTAGKAGTGARCITGAIRCASASRKPTARSRTACRTAK